MQNKCTFKEKQREKKRISTQPIYSLDKTYYSHLHRKNVCVQYIYEYKRHIYANSNSDENSLMDLNLHKINIYIRLVSGERRRHELPEESSVFCQSQEGKKTNVFQKKCLSFCINNNGSPGTFWCAICHLSISSFYETKYHYRFEPPALIFTQ